MPAGLPLDHRGRLGDGRRALAVQDHESGPGGEGPRALRALIAARERLRLERTVFFGLQDRAYIATEKPWWGPRVGLFDPAGRPKPAWRTFVGFPGGRPGGRLGGVSG